MQCDFKHLSLPSQPCVTSVPVKPAANATRDSWLKPSHCGYAARQQQSQEIMFWEAWEPGEEAKKVLYLLGAWISPVIKSTE